MSPQNDRYVIIASKSWIDPGPTDWLLSIGEPIACRFGHYMNARPVPPPEGLRTSYSDQTISLTSRDRKISMGGSDLSIVDQNFLDACGASELEKTFFVTPDSMRRRYALVPRDERLRVPLRCTNEFQYDFSFCKYCGSADYSIRSSADSAVLRIDLKKNWSVYVSFNNALLVSVEVAKRLKALCKGLQYESIPIIDEPADGLPADLYTLPRDYVHRYQYMPKS